MKTEDPVLGIEVLCRLFGKTRHAYYDYLWRKQFADLKDDLIIQLVQEIRSSLPRVGTRKLHFLLNQKLKEHQLKVGRDHLFDLLAGYKLLIRSRRRKALTTDSRHWMRKYENLIRDIRLERADQLWVSDITYIRLTNGFIYLSLITDAYSRKIVGYSLRKDLNAAGCIEALQKALKNRRSTMKPLIHHSDRGSQYCCKEYVDLLRENNIAISMTTNGDPYENAIAERVNGILKTEFSLYSSQNSFEQTEEAVQISIEVYNGLRPHSSCDYLTPDQAHGKTGKLERKWKNYSKSLLLTHKFEKNGPV